MCFSPVHQLTLALCPTPSRPAATAALTGLDSVFVEPQVRLLRTLVERSRSPSSTTWNQIDPALEDYVRQGGMLLLVPRRERPRSRLRARRAGSSAQLGNLHTGAAPPEPMLHARSWRSDLARPARFSSGRPQLGTVARFSIPARPYARASAWTPLLAAGQGGTLLVTRRELGPGTPFFASGLAFTPHANPRSRSKPPSSCWCRTRSSAQRSESLPVRLVQAGDPVALGATQHGHDQVAGG